MGHFKSLKWMILPYYVWLAMSVLGPFGYLIFVSFLNADGSQNSFGSMGFQSYLELLSPMYFQIFARSFINAISTAFCCVTLALPIAYWISRESPSTQRLILSAILIPFWSNFLVRVLAFADVLRIQVFGWSWLYTSNGVLAGMILTYLPMAILILYPVFLKIESDWIESARDLGANSLNLALSIIWPLVRPGVFTSFVLVFIPALGEFLIPDIIGGGQSFFLGHFFYNQFLVTRNWSLGSAGAVLLLLASLTLLLFFRSEGEKT